MMDLTPWSKSLTRKIVRKYGFSVTVNTDDFRETAVTELMDLFRGVVATGEYSDRVLDLTEEILEVNAANYTVWYVRVLSCVTWHFLSVSWRFRDAGSIVASV
jgi:UDP-glucose 6-dehydrogenase